MAVNTSFLSSTSTDYRNMLSELATFISNEQLNTIAINAAGTGYTVGDIITVSGGTTTGGVGATLRVTSISGGGGTGPVTGLEVWNAGSYSANPGATPTVTGGTGSGLTVQSATYQVPWTVERTLIQQGVVGAVIVNGGSGYVEDEVITLDDTGGTEVTAATITVGVTAGVVTSVKSITPGEYTAPPTNPVGQASSSGSGTGATFTLTFDGANSEDQYLFKGIGSGSDNIYVGVRTFQDGGASNHAWELAGMTGHNLIGTWLQQPGISPGRFDAGTGGAFVPLANITVNWWFNVTGRRIIVVAKISTSYSSMYLGFINPLATTTELPYPLLVGGCAAMADTAFNSNRQSYSSACFPVGKANTVSPTNPDTNWHDGPLIFRDGSGAWISFMNAYEPSSSTATSSVFSFRSVTPPGRIAPNTALSAGNTNWIQNSNVLRWDETAQVATASAPDFEIISTEDSGGDLVPLFPQTLIQVGATGATTLGETIFGDLDGVKWTSLVGTTLVAEDTVTVNSVVHRIFQSGTKTDKTQFFVMEER